MRVIMDSKYLGKVIEAGYRINDVCIFDFREDKMQVKIVEASHIAILIADFPIDMLKEYIVDSKKGKYELSLDDTEPIIKRLKGDIEISVDIVKEQDEIRKYLEIKSSNGHMRKYRMVVHDPVPLNDLKEPILKPTAVIRNIDLKELTEAIWEISTLSYGVIFEIDGKLRIKSEAGDVSEGMESIVHEFEGEVKKDDKVRSIYPTDTILKVFKVLKSVFSTVNIYMATDYPIIFEILGEGVSVRYYVAPRIEEGE